MYSQKNTSTHNTALATFYTAAQFTSPDDNFCFQCGSVECPKELMLFFVMT